MATCFDNLNGKKLVIGLVHLYPTPSTPKYEEGNLEKMTEKAIQDCLTLKANGADGGLIQTVEYMAYDQIGLGDDTDYARVAAMAMVTARVRDAVGPDFLIGSQIMWNHITPSLAVCKCAGADFTRCSALVGSTKYHGSEAVVVAETEKVKAYREKIYAQHVGLLSEISGYHHSSDESAVAKLVLDSIEAGANAIEVVDRDFERNERLVKAVKAADSKMPVILGGGTDVDNCKARLRYADGALVGTAFEGGKWGGPIIGSIVADYVKNVRELEEELAK